MAGGAWLGAGVVCAVDVEFAEESMKELAGVAEVPLRAGEVEARLAVEADELRWLWFACGMLS